MDRFHKGGRNGNVIFVFEVLSRKLKFCPPLLFLIFIFDTLLLFFVTLLVRRERRMKAPREDEAKEPPPPPPTCAFCTFPLSSSSSLPSPRGRRGSEDDEGKKEVVRLQKCAHSFHLECFKRWHAWRKKEWEREMEELNWPRGSEEDKKARAKPTHECPLCRAVIEETFDFSDDNERKKKEDEKEEEEVVMSEEMRAKLRKQRELFRRKLLKAREIGALVVKDPSKTNVNRPIVPRSRQVARTTLSTQRTNGERRGNIEERHSNSVSAAAAATTTSRGRDKGSGFLARALARARIEEKDDDDNG